MNTWKKKMTVSHLFWVSEHLEHPKESKAKTKAGGNMIKNTRSSK